MIDPAMHSPAGEEPHPKEIAKKIVDGGGDYLLAVKENQPTLSADIVAVFEEAREVSV